MNKQLEKKKALALDKDYKYFLENIKERLKAAQLRAALAANSELIKFYWVLGNDLIEKQKKFKWGEHFLEQFSHDMRQAFPGMKGFSVRNLQRVKQFTQLYPDLLITPRVVAQWPWGHISLLIHIVAEYALQNIKAPMGISEYVLSKALPNELKENLPTVEEIEAKLNEIKKR